MEKLLTMEDVRILHECLNSTARRFCLMYAGKRDDDYSVYGDGLTFMEVLDTLMADNRVGYHVIYDNHRLRPVAVVSL